MTLVELLIVIALVTTLVTTAIPILSPGGDSRKLREASRNINAYFAGAQARAIETGRPFGVALHRSSFETDRAEDDGVCQRLSYVEVPAPFSGLGESSVARIGEEYDSGGVRRLKLQFLTLNTSGPTATLPPGYEPALLPGGLLRPGDTVEVGSHRWRLTSTPTGLGSNPEQTTLDAQGYFNSSLDGGSTLLLTFGLEEINFQANVILQSRRVEVFNYNPVVDGAGAPLGSPEALAQDGLTGNVTWAAPKPFKVYRQPTPASGEPLQLPSGIAVDLFASGTPSEQLYRTVDSTNYGTANSLPVKEPIVVMFSPEGSISLISRPALRGVNATTPTLESLSVSESVALCIGRRELIPAEVSSGTRGDKSNDWPIDPRRDLSGLDEQEALEVTDKYNWLNLESRWVVIGAQSGSINTVENTTVLPAPADRDNNGELTIGEQLAAARENAPGRINVGGR